VMIRAPQGGEVTISQPSAFAAMMSSTNLLTARR
jgi:hypothetical protein